MAAAYFTAVTKCWLVAIVEFCSRGACLCEKEKKKRKKKRKKEEEWKKTNDADLGC